MSTTKVLLADSQRMFTEVLKLLLEATGSFKVVSQCAGSADLLQEMASLKPEILILDIAGFAEGDGLLKKIYDIDPESKVCVLTARKDPDFVYNIYRTGVSGYVLKTSESATLFKALSVIKYGSQFIEPVLIPSLKDSIDRLESDIAGDDYSLTKRELAILQYVANGLFNKEIAFNLGIKEKTVKNHITNLFKKIGVKDRIQAAVFAVKNGYVNL